MSPKAKSLLAVLTLFLVIQPSHVQAETKSPTVTFDNLYKSRKIISQTAWSNFSKQYKSQKEPLTSIKILIGPKTKPLYKTPEKAVSYVARAFSKYEPAKNVTFIQYQYSDIKWASGQLQKLVSTSQFQQFTRNEGGRLFDSHCDSGSRNCFGAKALTADSGEAFILQGVPNEAPVGKADKARMTTGMLEAHEYFHTLQDIAFRGKSLERSKFPPIWLTEGSAELVQNLAVNQGSFKNYLEFIKSDSANLYGNYINSDPVYIGEYLDFANNKNYWENYPGDIAYSLGSRICEILVAVKGPNSLIDFNNEMGKGIGFEKAFLNVYGKSWKQVQPIIAKTLAANIKDYL